MKANAPEKIYVSLFKGEYSVSRYPVNNDIEYTRTDAFIEKACQWFKSLDDSEIFYNTTEDFINAFRKIMGE